MTSEANQNSPIIGWHNLANVDSISATSEDENYPATNLANPATDQIWRSLIATEQYLTVASGSSDEMDYVAIARHNFFTAGVAVSVQGDVGAGFPGTELVAAAIPPNDGPLILRFPPRILDNIRLKLAASVSVPEAAVLHAGKLLILERRIYVGHAPLPYARRTTVTNSKSENGKFTGRIVIGSTLETEITISNMTPTFFREEINPFLVAAREGAFFFSWRPGDYPLEMSYAWLTNDPQALNARPNGMMEIALQIGGIVS